MNLGLGLHLGGRRSAGFNPASLFSGGEQGVFFDVTPTTAGVSVGSTVATLTDTSGRGNNATQATSGLRPTLQTEGGRFYLDFAGAQGMGTSSINMSATDEVTIIAGVLKGSNAAAAIVCEHSANTNTNVGSFYIAAPEATGASSDYTHSARASAAAPTPISTGAFLAPDLAVITAQLKYSTPLRLIRRNGVQRATSAASMGTGNLGNYAFFIGARNNASVFFNGRIYGLIVINRLLTAGEIAQAEAWMAAKTGVTL